MNNTIFDVINRLLDWLKNVLVRFKKAGFGLFFIKNIFELPDFFIDKECSIFSKMKVVFTFLITLFYFISSFDFIPEFMLGGFGFVDDLFILIWSIGLINEEISNYKNSLNNNSNSRIIDDVDWTIEDDE